MKNKIFNNSRFCCHHQRCILALERHLSRWEFKWNLSFAINILCIFVLFCFFASIISRSRDFIFHSPCIPQKLLENVNISADNYYIRTLFISNSFISNTRLKLGKKWNKCEATLWSWTLAISKLFTFFIHVIIQKL